MTFNNQNQTSSLSGADDIHMKDSGVPWIGEIPLKWDIERIKSSCSLRGRIGWQGLKSDEFVNDGPYVITGVDFDNGKIKWDSCNHFSRERFEEDPKIHVVEGDLLITKDGTVGKVAIATNAPDEVSLNSGVMIIRPYIDLNRNYLRYVLVSQIFWNWYESNQRGNSTIRHLYQEQFYDFKYPFPPIKIQSLIASYLDTQCNLIDQQIAAVKETIEKFTDFKESIITEAVTKGIDFNCSMSHSDVPYLESIPSPWSTKPIKRVALERSDVLSNNTEPYYYFRYVEIGDVSFSSGISNYEWMRFSDSPSRARKIVKDGDVIISTVRTYLKAITSVQDSKDLIVSTGFLVIVPDTIDSDYLRYALRSQTFLSNVIANSYGVSYPAIPSADIMDMKIPVPPEDVQKIIVEYLDEQCKPIDSLISALRNYCDKLIEFKSSLIYEYVTGKKQILQEVVA